MKQKILITLALAGIYTCQGQTVTPVVLSNQGGFFSSSSGNISWTIGEPVSETYNGATKLMTMGFHQPELDFITLIKEQGEEQSVLVFPNPVKDMLSINFKGLAQGNYKLELIDNIGKIIYQSQTEVTEGNSTFQLKVNEVAAGNYFLRVDSKNFSKTVKINKVN
jgi:hypothetical protein